MAADPAPESGSPIDSVRGGLIGLVIAVLVVLAAAGTVAAQVRDSDDSHGDDTHSGESHDDEGDGDDESHDGDEEGHDG